MKIHSIPPTYDENSEILILGSFPSVKSREEGYFYAHPQNRFWEVISKVYNADRPEGISEKRAFLIKNRIAVWDVIAECDIDGSADSSIREVKANEISHILKASKIGKIYVNGRKAEALYKEHIEPRIGIKAIYLPSTSSANAAWKPEDLIAKWRVIKPKGRES